MAVRIESMAEPLPGYRLIERLGGGGFGEVWKAEAPGGLFKAIKFVYGDLDAMDEDGARAGQEFKALQRVITVRHPFILSVERFDVIDGQLIIVTELADRTLWDRFRECRSQGLIGIPRVELLGYLDDTAEALDLMNSMYQLQHLDIKPQNLFLVHNHVKVADFGLVKDLEGMMASVTGGVTPVYASPETFEGKVSRFSDQYSLAIVYQELLTGQRPYSGTTLRQLVMQHCQGTPDLKPLPEADRPVILRGLAKNHEERFPTCKALVDALRVAGQAPVRPSAVVSVPAQDMTETIDVSTEEGGETRPQAAEPLQPQQTSGPTQAIHGRRRDPLLAPPAEPIDIKSPGIIGPAEIPTHAEDSDLQHSSEGVLAPALVIGLGHLGLATLRQLREETINCFGSVDALPSLRLLYIDTDPQALQIASRGREQLALRTDEVMLAKLHRPSHYIRPRDGVSGLETWLSPKMLYRMPRQQTATGVRSLGRLAFVDNYKYIARRLEIELMTCCSKQVLDKARRESGLAVRTAIPRVYIVTSLGGGTGSGMFLDLAYLVRHKLKQHGYLAAEVIGICFLPAAHSDPRRAGELANAFAALTELNHFSGQQAAFSARYNLGEVRTGDPMFTLEGPPLQRCRFFTTPGHSETHMSDEADGVLGISSSLTKKLGLAARMLLAEVTTPLGKALDEQAHPGNSRVQRGPAFQTAGMYRTVWPRRKLLERAANVVCRRVVQRWMSKNAKPIQDAVKSWVADKWEQNGFTAEQLIGRYQQACDAGLGQSPDSQFQIIHATVAKELAPSKAKSGEQVLNFAVVVNAMEQLEHLVGIPEECRPQIVAGESESYKPGTVETLLDTVAVEVVEQFEQKLAELAVGMIEDPTYRLAGAEEALRQLHVLVEQALQSHEQLAHELNERATVVYRRIQALTENGRQHPQSASWKPPSRRQGAGQPPGVTELLELLRSFPKCRFQGLIMQRITSLYTSLRGLLSDQLREVDFCRTRLSDLSAEFGEAPKGKTHQRESPAAGRYLCANGAKSIEEAVQNLEGSVDAQELIKLDHRMQQLIRSQFKALVYICMSSANVLKNVVPAMQKEARTYLRGRLGDMHAADIYLQQFHGPAVGKTLQDDLTEAIERAAPEVVALPPVDEFNVLAVPPGDAEENLRKEAAKVLIGKPFVAVPSSDEITIYREHTLACLADLPQMGHVGQEAYEKAVAQENFTPHSRCDITEWGTRNRGD